MNPMERVGLASIRGRLWLGFGVLVFLLLRRRRRGTARVHRHLDDDQCIRWRKCRSKRTAREAHCRVTLQRPVKLDRAIYGKRAIPQHKTHFARSVGLRTTFSGR